MSLYADFICDALLQTKSLAEELNMDLDDQVYFYYPMGKGARSNITIVEAYKIKPDLPVISMEYGSWNQQVDLTEIDIFENRRDLQVHYLNAIVVLLYFKLV